MGRLVAGGGALRQHEQVRAVAPSEFDARLVPEVGGDAGKVLRHLRWAGQVDDNAGDGAVRVPREEDVHAVVLVSLDVGEVVHGCLAVHPGSPVQVDGATVVPDDRMAEGGADARGTAPLPRLYDDLGDPCGKELGVFSRRHHFGALRRVEPPGGVGRVVRVRGVQEQLADVKVRQARHHGVTHSLLEVRRHVYAVARHDDGAVRRTVRGRALDGQGGRRDRVRHPFRDAHVELPVQIRGAVRGNVATGPSDPHPAPRFLIVTVWPGPGRHGCCPSTLAVAAHERNPRCDLDARRIHLRRLLCTEYPQPTYPSPRLCYPAAPPAGQGTRSARPVRL